MGVNYQPSKFEPVRLYDAPTVLIDSLFSGELTTRGVANTLFNPAGLTASERTTYATRLKEAAGGGLAGDLAAMAVNPLTWMAFFFRPGGRDALKGGARLFPRTARRDFFLPWVHNAGELYKNTALDAGAMGMLRGISKVHTQEWEPIVEHAERALVQSLGYDPRKFSLADVVRKHPEHERLVYSIVADVAGLDRDITRVVKQAIPTFHVEGAGVAEKIADPETLASLHRTWRRNLEAGNTQPITVSQVEGRWVVDPNGAQTVVVGDPKKGQVQVVSLPERSPAFFGDRKLVDSTPGARALANAYHNAMQLRLLRLVGTDEAADAFAREALKPGAKALSVSEITGKTGNDLVDVSKIQRLHRLYAHEKLGGTDGVDSWGTWDLLFHSSIREARAAGSLNEADWTSLVTEAFGSRIQEQVFLPRAMPAPYTIDVKGDPLTPVRISDRAVYRGDRRLGLSGMSTSGLKQTTSAWGEESLNKIAQLFPESAEAVEAQRYRFLKGFESAFQVGQPRWAQEFDPLAMINKFGRQTAADYALAIADTTADDALAIMQKEALDAATSLPAHQNLPGNPNTRVPRNVVFRESSAPSGGWAYMDVVDQTADLVADEKRAGYLFDLLLPGLLGRRPQDLATTEGLIGLAQTALRKTLSGPLRAQMESTAWGRQILPRMEALANDDPRRLAGSVTNEAASYLYGTHIGANPGTVLLQMTQPWLHLATHVGMKEVGAAQFLDAPQEMFKYFQLRSKLPMRISNEQRQQLYKEAFENPELLGVHGHVLESLDEMALNRYTDHGGWTKFWVQEAPMMPFAWAEIWNRLTTIHAVRRRYEAAGISVRGLPKDHPDYTRFAADTRAAQRDTQFSTGVMDTPIFLQKAPFNNPLMRMLMSFSVRAPTAFVTLGRGVAGGKRSDVLGISEKWPWQVADTMRMLGISSIVYGLGKAVGGDLSPGLAEDSLLGLISDRQSVYEGGVKTAPINLPPPVSLGINLTLGAIKAAGGDTSLLRDNLMRVVPAGVGISKMLNAAPQLPAPLSMMQKKYADWGNQTPTGEVPIFSWDGRIIEYKKPSAIIFGSLGVDLGAHKKGGEIDAWLAKQRDEIISYRHRMLMALGANDLRKVSSIRGEFEKRFQVPLTVSKEQLRAYIKQRNVPRTERMLDTFPREARPQVRQMLTDSYARMGMDREAWLGHETSTRRNALLGRTSLSGLDPETLTQLDSLIAESNARKQPSERTFE